MIGSNELVLCESEMMVAMQEYLDKRMGEYTPKVVSVSKDGYGFKLVLSAKDAL